MNAAMRRVLEAFSANGENLPRVAEQTRHEAVRRAELAEAGRELDRRTFAARLMELQVARDQLQAAVITARAEVEHLSDQLGTARQDLADETARADAAEREVARLGQELECLRGEGR